MLAELPQEPWFYWSMGLSLAFPLIMLILTELIQYLRRVKSPLLGAMKICRLWIIPLVAFVLLLTKVFAISQETVPLKLLRTVLFLTLVLAALAAMDALIFEDAPEDSWQAKVPSILIDLCRVVLVVLGLAIILANVWGADLGGLLTALGVGSLVIGLALQDSLGNLFSGIALLLERPFGVGDWIRIHNTVGLVVAITWRSVHLRTRQRQLIVVPNSVLAKESFCNFSRPNKVHGEDFHISFSYDDPPNKVIDILEEIGHTTDGILTAPPPIVQILSYDDFSITYLLRFFISDYTDMPRIRSAVTARIWYATQRYGLTIPFPIRTLYPSPTPPPREEQEAQKIVQALHALPRFNSISANALESLSRDALLYEYGANEIIIMQGKAIAGIYLILHGDVKVSCKDSGNNHHNWGVLSKGDVFGEKLLLGQMSSDVTVRACGDVEVIRFDAAIFQSLLDHIPNLAAIVSETMEARRRTSKVY